MTAPDKPTTGAGLKRYEAYEIHEAVRRGINIGAGSDEFYECPDVDALLAVERATHAAALAALDAEIAGHIDHIDRLHRVAIAPMEVQLAAKDAEIARLTTCWKAAEDAQCQDACRFCGTADPHYLGTYKSYAAESAKDEEKGDSR